MLEVTPTLRRARPRKNIEIPKETWKLYGFGGGDPGPRIVPSCHPGWGAVLLKEALKWDTAIVVPPLELRLPLFN